QQQGKANHNLVETNLVIPGKGTDVLLASVDLLHALDQRTQLATNPTNSGSPAALPTPTPAPPMADIGPSPTINTDEEDGRHTEVRYGNGGHPVSSPLVIN